MKYFYGEYDGEPFPTPDKLFNFDQLMNFIMQYGEQALKAIQKMMNDPENPQQSDLLEQLLKEGMLDKDGKGKLKLTPRAIGRMQQKALMEVFSNLRQGEREGHEKVTPGQGGERIEGTKPYQYGDPVSELDLHQTIRNALTRHGLPQDSIDFVGFYSGAAKIPEAVLPLSMPKPVTIYDYQVRLKVPVDQIAKAPQ